jgi:hypothetical protein
VYRGEPSTSGWYSYPSLMGVFIGNILYVQANMLIRISIKDTEDLSDQAMTGYGDVYN